MYAITGLFKGHLFDLPFYWFLEMRYIKRELWDSWGGGGSKVVGRGMEISLELFLEAVFERKSNSWDVRTF